jgi:DNA-directed RNA polymerase sigma subunit (sigma70/sigma32)
LNLPPIEMATLPENWVSKFLDSEIDDMMTLAKNPTSLERNYGDDRLDFQGAYLSTIKTLQLSSEVQYYTRSRL